MARLETPGAPDMYCSVAVALYAPRLMAARTGVVLIHRFIYRGDASEEFSHSYFFKGPPPGDDSSWLVLCDDLINLEKPIYSPQISFVAAYGYDSDDPAAHAVFAHDFTQPGPPPTGTRPEAGQFMAGDQAACVEWKTDAKNARGKWIYLRKYIHQGIIDPSSADNLETAYMAKLQTYADFVQLFHGGLTAQRNAYNVTSSRVLPYVTTRTLKRRGKRPPLAA